MRLEAPYYAEIDAEEERVFPRLHKGMALETNVTHTIEHIKLGRYEIPHLTG